jgi:hypothetical protein
VTETQIGPRLNGAASAARLNAQNWQLIEALDDGVYATPAGETQTGLWLFPWSGSGERQVTGTGFWHAIGGGSAWGIVSPSVPEGAATVIMRMILAAAGRPNGSHGQDYTAVWPASTAQGIRWSRPAPRA